jgi:acetoacetyl-CoA synthetase
LRAILSTGSPLAPESFDWVYRAVKPDLQLASISGGTDIISCFALGNPVGPVYRGQLQCRGLGMAVEVFDEEGKPVASGTPGELVCTKPFVSMPTGFFGDEDGSRYRGAYFERFENVWHHGDFAEITPEGGMVFHGRSDATLNPGGVRIGTAEIYRVVEAFDEIVEGVVVGQSWEDDTRIILFVRLADGARLDPELSERIQHTIREQASPHHVPRRIIAVPDIPRTISGKISEIAVRKAIHGEEIDNLDSLANPESLEAYRDIADLAR